MTPEGKKLQLFLLFQFRTSDKETNLFQRISWDYKVFDENKFNNDVKTKLDSFKILDYSSFEDLSSFELH